MARKLEDMLDTGERVVFRARYGPVGIAVYAAILAATVVISSIFGFDIVIAVIEIFFGVEETGSDWRVEAGLGVFWFAKYALTIWRRIILVTNRRVLYRHGTWWWRVTEFALNDIKNAGPELGFGNFTPHTWIERLSGGKTIIAYVPRLADLQRAIAAQAGFPPPQRFDRIVYFGIFLVTVSTNLFGIAAVLVLSLIIKDLLFHLDLFPIDFTSLAYTFVSVGFSVFLLIEFLAGAIFGHLVSLVVLRYFLTPDHARQVVCIGYASIPTNWAGNATRWYIRQTARFASWLYGQEIRCD